MEDLPNLLHRDYGLKQQGKSVPMSQQRNTAGTGNMAASSVYDDVFGGPPKFTAQSFQEAGAYDDIFRSFSAPIKNSSVPVFDTPVYDDDIFGGLKGVKSSGVPYDDVFSEGSVAPIGDLVGENSNLGNRQKGPSSLFDDLIPGLSVEKSRSGGESRPKHRLSTASSQKPSKDSFVVPDPDLSSNSASTFASNSLEQLNVSSIPMSTKESKVPDNSTRGIDEINTFDGYPSTGRVSSSPMNKSRVAKSPLETSHSNSPHTSDNNELVEGKAVKRNSMISNFVRDHSKPPSSSKVSSPRRHRQPLHENSTYVTDLGTSRLSPLKKSEKGTNAVTERLVTVDEIKLRTKPSMLPPPSRPPPPLVIKQGPSKQMLDSNAGVNSNVLTTHRLKSGKSSKYLTKELEDSASGGSRIQHRGDKSSILMDGMVEGSSAAAASTAAMKEAMERAEVRLKLAKEARERKKGDWEREAKTAKFHEKEKQNRGDERITRDDWELDEREGVVKAEEALQQEEKEKAAKRVREAHQREEKEKAAKAAREREEKEAAAKAARMAREREQREREEQERERRQKEREREREEREREQERDREREREREREKDRIAVERATKEARERAERTAVERAAAEARERAAAEAREKSERAAFERAAAEARERAAAEAKERAAAGKSVAAVRERAAAAAERAAEARIRAERAASERAIAEARERAAERASAERVAAEARERTAERAAREARERVAERASAEKAAAEARERAERAAAGARERQRRNENDLEAFFGMGVQAESASRQRTPTSDATSDAQSSNKGTSGDVYRKATAGTSHNYNRSNVSAKTADDWMSSFNVPSSEEFQEIPGESSERRRARLERHQRTRERAAKALAEKNDRDLQVQREQAERHRLAETLDADVKRWATGKEGNLRALLSTLQYILWPESGWQPVSLTDIITAPAVKKVYRKATLCVHPDKVQQKGATIQQKYVAEKVFDLLKEAWNKFNSEELF